MHRKTRARGDSSCRITDAFFPSNRSFITARIDRYFFFFFLMSQPIDELECFAT
jgi:hypothetical protein